MKMIPSRTRCVRFLVTVTAALAAAVPSLQAFSIIQANELMEAHKNTFYVHNNGSGYHKKSTSDSSRLDFWKQAELIEMTIDAYERTGKSSYLTMVNSLLTGFSDYYGTSWSWNEYNDDIMWGAMAYARGYLVTGNTTYRTIAKNNFDMAYSRGWDSAGGGGMFWRTTGTSKNSCVNFPASIAAYLLYQALGQSSYLTKAQNIFNWGRTNLTNGNGLVYDTLTNHGATSYNQGSFVGAANYLGDTTSAAAATNYVKNNMGSIDSASGQRMFPGYNPDNNNDLGGFNSIAYRWIAKFVGERNLQSTYGAWLQANGDRCWANRRSDNLSWNVQLVQTPSTELWAWGCASTVTCLQTVPAGYASEQTYLLRNRNSGLFIGTQSGATGNNTPLEQYSYNGSNSMKWSLTQIGNGQLYFTNVAAGRAMSINGASSDNNAYSKIYDYFGGSQQKVTLYGNHGFYYAIVFVHSGKSLRPLSGSTASGADIVQYNNDNSKEAQWSLWIP